MEQTLLSRKDLATRWGVSTATVDRRVREGKLTPVKGFKTPQFNLYDILKIEGTDTSKLSPFERRRLEREKAELEQKVMELEEENRNIKKQLTNMMADIALILKEV